MQYNNRYNRIKRRKNRMIKVGIALGTLFFFIGLFFAFSIREITVYGNSHYTKEEIKEKVFAETYFQNSIVLYVKRQLLKPEEIPFIDKLEVSFLNPWQVEVRVYEKELVGYINYMGSKFYFDKDGVVVGSTSQEVKNISLITGMSFDTLGLYKKISVEDESIFQKITTISQLMEKHQLYPDEIEFSDALKVTVHFENLRVELGNDELLEQKISRLSDLFSDLEGRSGVFHMENYTESSKFISFEQD